MFDDPNKPLTPEIEHLFSMLGRYAERQERLEAQVASLTAEKERLIAEAAQQAADVKHIIEAGARHNDDIARLKKEVARRDAVIKDDQDRIGQLLIELEEVKGERRSFESELENLRGY